jgi:myo-inositol-1(or 4)-monophosphatase
VTGGRRDEDLLPLAVRAARAAGDLLNERFGGPATGLAAKSSRTDLVSDTDRDAEALILGIISAARPDDAIVAEEGGGADGPADARVRWLVDPLDGTINFLWGIPQWSVSVAAFDREGPLVGVVHDPCRDETFSARRGAGARLGDEPLALGPGAELDQALIGTGFDYRAEERARQAERLRAVLPAVRDVRRFGSAAIDLAWVAAGRLDGYFETGLNAWDWAAGRLLVCEAGGVVQELPPAGGGPGGVVAAPPGLIGPLRALVDAAGAAPGRRAT